ncbi:MAG: hypothetical protein H0U92_15250, partial [Actinobacteria bacterium]|nr:hypothetical protein [Actinomycetota bacterium]
QYTWTAPYANGPARLDAIIDPVSDRRYQFVYSEEGQCATISPPDGRSDLVHGPIGSLCTILWSTGGGGGQFLANFFYDVNSPTAQLRMIEEPGYADGKIVTEFGYSGGKIVSVRDPLAYNAIKAGQAANDATSQTAIAYTSVKASTITLPQTNAAVIRSKRRYTIGASSTTVKDYIGSLLNGTQYTTRTVDFDAAARHTHTVDAAGVNSYTEWNNDDQVTATVDGAGLKSTTIYDYAKRPTNTYGPAPQSCFTGATPNGSCTNPAVPGVNPAAVTRYDENLNGLAAAYWDNKAFTGAPRLHALGVGDPSNRLVKTWNNGTGPNAADGTFLTNTGGGLVHNLWAARFTGEIQFPSAGTYQVNAWSDDGVRIWVDDTLVADRWVPQGFTPSGTVASIANATAGSWHRIRVDYFDESDLGRLELNWSGPGVSGIVPGANLRPRYGLVTSAVDADGKQTKSVYNKPELGMASEVATDPSGLNLRSLTSHEARGAGYLRRTNSFTPRGAQTPDPNDYGTSYSYYATGDADASTCAQRSTTGRLGLLKQVTPPDPSGAQGPITRQFVYDWWGRQVGMRVNSENWACTEYDQLGRITKVTAADGKVSTIAYNGLITTAQYVDSGGTSRQTTTTVDVLGRVVSYTDEWATATENIYDQRGRLTTTNRTMSGQAKSQLTSMAYDETTGRLTSSTEYASGTGRTTNYAYDAVGRPSTSTLPNGVVTTTTYDPSRGAVTGIRHAKGAATFANWTYGLSLGGQTVSDAESVSGRTRAFTFDGADRLTRTVDSQGGTRDYAFDANTNRCANAAACDGQWSYDEADRLLASPYASSYVYDAHGNVVSAALNAGADPPESSSETLAYDTAPQSYPITPLSDGVLSAALDWAASSPLTTGTSSSGTLAASPASTTVGAT